jgi:hypothetical protein
VNDYDTLTFTVLPGNSRFLISDTNCCFIVNSYTGQIGVCNFIDPGRENMPPELRNAGSDNIHSLAIYSLLEGGMNCLRNEFYRKTDGIAILPGQTHIMEYKKIYQDGVGQSTLCFECLAPNSGLETVTDNNRVCKTITVTGTDDRLSIHYRIFPNPASGYLTIDNPELSLKMVELSDLSGRVMLRQEYLQQHTRVRLTFRIIYG